MKIRIVGGSGSGKTHLAKKLSKKLNISHLDTDELKWKSKKDYSVSRTREEKRILLNTFLKNYDSWIVEGATGSPWNWRTFVEADIIIILKAPLWREYSRVLKRSLRRFLGLEKGRKERLKDILDLYRWVKKFRTENMPALLQKLDQENIKYIICKNKNDRKRVLESPLRSLMT